MSQQWNDAQNKILETLSGNMVASASAGSGKTTVMLERIIRLVKLGRPIKNMVVLAYNISIAAEIKEKLKKALIGLLADDNCDKVFIGEQIDNIDICNICTIDSFCSNLIKEYFQLIKIDTNFIIMTVVQQQAEFRRIALAVIQAEKDSNLSEIYDEIIMFGGEDKLIQSLLDLNNFVAVLPNRENYFDNIAQSMYKADFTQTSVYASFKALTDKHANYCIDIIDEAMNYAVGLSIKKVEQLQYLRAALVGAIGAKSYDELRRIISSVEMTKLRANKEDQELAQGEYSRAFYIVKSVIKSDFNWLSAQDIASEQKVCGTIVEHVLAMLKKVSGLFIEFKRERGLFDFSDLTYWAIKVLEHDSVSLELKERYTEVCIDEFQDANYCQDYILSRITKDNLFVVGDTKQSIYGFRLAEPTILDNKFKAAALDSKAVAVRLNNNYRSDEFILEFVNRIFDCIMIPALSGVDYSKDERLIVGMPYAHKSVSNDSFEISLFVGETKDEKKVYDFSTDIYDITEQDCGESIPAQVLKEGEWVALKIKAIVGVEDIYDPKIKSDDNDGWRKVKYSDICILARSRRRQLQQIVKIIQEHSIPIDTKSLDKTDGDYYVNQLNEMLKVIDNDRQDTALVAALVSPWGRMTYQDLADIRVKSTNAQFFHEACLSVACVCPKLKEFYRLIDKARVKLATSSLHELASWLVYDNYFCDAIGLDADGDNHKHILKQYLDLIKSSNITLSEYIRGLDGELKFEFSQYPDTLAQDMVLTATIHFSKGLEYPIVFLVDCNDPIHKRGDPSKLPTVFARRNEGLAIDCYDADTLNKKSSIFADIFRLIKRDEEELEAMRVLYVALTRARNRLYVSANVEISSKAIDDGRMPSCSSLLDVKSFADWILYVKDRDTCINGNFRFIICNTQEIAEGKYNPTNRLYTPNVSSNLVYEEALDYVYPYKKSLELGIKYTVTEINQMDAYEDSLQHDILTQYEPLNKAVRGTNYHKVLENIDYMATSQERVQAELDRMLQEGIMTKEELQVIDCLEIASVMRASIMKYAAVNKHLREKKFMLTADASDMFGKDYGQEEILIQGAIDLVILGKKTYVVDFKKTKKTDEQIKLTYSKQLEIYAQAVQEALGVKVDGKIIVEIGSGREINL